MATSEPYRRIALKTVGQEPFRVFFPAGMLAGLMGVGLWPLHLGGWLDLYPGQSHARVMAYGFFGAFIFGFLGTAMPRLLSVRPLGTRNVLVLLGLHLAMVLAFAMGKMAWGDLLFLILLGVFALLMAVRIAERKDTPPPGFVLVALGFGCVAFGAVLAVMQHADPELNPRWILFQRLLSYQGFVLLPILGIGPFILPRFFGLASNHEFPETLAVSGAWLKKAALALGAGLLIIGSFTLEVWGWYRLAHAVRFAAALAYLAIEFPVQGAPSLRNPLGACLRMALGALVLGFLLVALFPGYRAALLHLTLVGGFAVVTFVVATRVVFGHSGNLEKLKGRNRWMFWAVGLMLVGMATRISGDLWPKVMASHYVYGAVLWMLGVLVWAGFVLPKVLVVEPEEGRS